MIADFYFRHLLAELVKEWDNVKRGIIGLDDLQDLSDAMERARPVLSAPEQGATDEEVDALVVCIQGLPVPDADDLALPSTGRGRDMVRRALARWCRPAVEPVPVAERLPGPEDCDAENRCWQWDVRWDAWVLYTNVGIGLHPLSTYWLPHWAIPVPQEGADG